jgi:hypothetical protein
MIIQTGREGTFRGEVQGTRTKGKGLTENAQSFAQRADLRIGPQVQGAIVRRLAGDFKARVGFLDREPEIGVSPVLPKPDVIRRFVMATQLSFQ